MNVRKRLHRRKTKTIRRVYRCLSCNQDTQHECWSNGNRETLTCTNCKEKTTYVTK